MQLVLLSLEAQNFLTVANMEDVQVTKFKKYIHFFSRQHEINTMRVNMGGDLFHGHIEGVPKVKNDYSCPRWLNTQSRIFIRNKPSSTIFLSFLYHTFIKTIRYKYYFIEGGQGHGKSIIINFSCL